MFDFLKLKINNQFIRIREWRDVLFFYIYRKQSLFVLNPELIRGKRVVIIGGADSAFKEKMGDYIDNFDIVVRINNGVKVIDGYSDYIGTKTDILFHSFYDRKSDPLNSSPCTVSLWKKHNVKYLICCYNINHSEYKFYIKNFVARIRGRLKTYQISEDMMWNNHKIIGGAKPTTGFSAINTIFNCKPSEMYITGVTFFKTPHNESYRKFEYGTLQKQELNNETSHRINLEYSFVKELYYQNVDVIKVDPVLLDIFSTN